MNQELWQKAVAFHGHECPGLAIGFKACEAAMARMGLGQSDDEQIVCITENDACGVDAVQALLSCTMGKGNLIFHGTGKQAFSFYNRADGQKLRVCLKSPKKEGMERSEWQALLLDSPVEELFNFSEPRYELPEKARLFATHLCAVCGEGTAEHRMRLQDGQMVCIDCFKSYDRGW
jgi:formylmethanofuran dehydrogenase subunit E